MVVLLYLSLITLAALLFVWIKYVIITKQSDGTKRMREISDAIHTGAISFLDKEYRVLIFFIIIIALVLAFFINKGTALSFVIGSFFSAMAGYIGMNIATKANVRTTEAVKKSLNAGLRIAFSSGTVMAMCVVGLGLLGIIVLYTIFRDPTYLYGFGFGASFVALFARVGGGIYTKAADIGADLVGKVEKGIPEDDPRNPAVIADNVGDNVGDVAGMGADLFESYVDSIIAAMVLGFVFVGEKGLILPLLLAASGIIASILGTFFVRVSGDKLYSAMNKGIFASTALMTLFSYFVIRYYLNNMNLFYTTLLGLAAGLIIGFSTEYVTSTRAPPTKSIAESAQTGAATTIINGLSVGMLSTAVPVVTICFVILIAFKLSGLYGIAIASVGMLSILGITLAADSYGPVADNAAGIAEMAKLGSAVRKRAELLDEVGNTTAAIGKGFAIGSAALTTLALFASYIKITNLATIDISKPQVIVGLFIGALLPFVFSALTMSSVGKAAFKIINEVRRQFKTIKGLMSGKAKPDYKTCVSISTQAALHEMIVPGLLAVLSPLIIGLLLGAEALGGMLAGSIATGFLFAVFMANSGGAWDNAKKYIEEGNFGGKGSPTHKAAVIGDTVGDPFKDTSGPSLNILIKLMSIVALVFVPLLI
jgi:K(+)-stimulated pyrophosphate-energized sodium pump